MKSWATLFAVALTYLVSVSFANDGYSVGKWNFKQFDVGTKVNPLDSLSPFHVRVSFPTTCASQCGEFRTGGMPVFLFATGFGGQIDAYKYDVVLSGIARHGIIVVAIDREAGYALTLDYGKLGIQLQKVIGWIRSTDSSSGLLYELRQRGFLNEIYKGASKIIMGGHSSGAQIPLRNIRDTATSTLSCPDAGGVVMLSPVDGQDVVGLGGDQVIVPGQSSLPFSTPALLIAASKDGDSSDIIQGIPCGPVERSNKHFYDPWVGTINYMEVDGVGHLDVLNEASKTDYDDYCARSNATATAYRLSYRNVVRGAIVNFIQATVLGSADYANLITAIPPNTVKITTEEKGVGSGFTCAYVPVATMMAAELQTGLILFGLFFALTFISGLYCFFRKMDDDTLHRYHPAEGIGYDQPASFQTKLEPQYGVSSEYPQPSFSLNGSQATSRAPSINV